MAFSMSRYVDGRASARAAIPRIARRCIILFALGLVVNGFSPLLQAHGSLGPVLANLRIMGVLQRIALCYLLGSAVVLVVRRIPLQVLTGAVVLVGYWLAMTLVPVSGHGPAALTAILLASSTTEQATSP